MKFEIKEITTEEWKSYSDKAAMISFGERFKPENDRIDLAYLVVDGDVPAGFMTIKEMDAETAYIQHGGVFPDHAETVHVWREYMNCIGKLSEKYAYIWTRVDHTNTSMIKMALKAGFLITGIIQKFPATYLEMEYCS